MTREEREKAIRVLDDMKVKIDIPKAAVMQKDKNWALDVAINTLEQELCEDKGEISDGYHTFNQLYHQRAVLFATIVNQHKDKAWKSFKHSDGQYCFGSNGEWFIVGVDTPQGSYTYHYEKKYWDYFDCKELDCGKEWDGHTEKDVTRLLSLEQEPCEDAISRQAAIKALSNMMDTDGFRDGWAVSRANVDCMLKSLSPVTPKPKIGHWIPVSERLPEEREWYLAVFKETDTGFQLIPRVADYIGKGKNEWRLIDEDGLVQEYRDILECVAWMPLLEP